MHVYWLNVRPHAKKIYPEKKLIWHMHVGLKLIFLKFWFKTKIFFSILAYG